MLYVVAILVHSHVKVQITQGNLFSSKTHFVKKHAPLRIINSMEMCMSYENLYRNPETAKVLYNKINLGLRIHLFDKIF